MSVKNVLSYFNPCASNHHAVADFKEKLSGKQKAAVIIATVLAAIASLPAFGVGGIAAFRRVVKNYSDKKNTKATAAFTQTIKNKGAKPTTSSLSKTKNGDIKPVEKTGSKTLTIACGDMVTISHKQLQAGLMHFVKGFDEKKVPKEKIEIIEKAIKAAFTQDIAMDLDAEEKEFDTEESMVKFEEGLKALNEDALAAFIKEKAKELFQDLHYDACEECAVGNMTIEKAGLDHFEAFIPKIKTLGHRAVYIQANNLFKQFNCKEGIKHVHFKTEDVKKLRLDAKHRPAYFSEEFANHSPAITNSAGFYHYNKNQPGAVEFHVDFANMHLGGHLDGSYVQEEIMFSGMPNLMNWVSHPTRMGKHNMCQVMVRDGKDGVYGGIPNPRIFKNAVRVQEFKGKYGMVPPVSELKDTTIPLAAPQHVNVLAMAAPRLASKSAKDQLSIKTAEDMFNTILAGFTLARSDAPADKIVIHSGRLGCGVFNNNPDLVFLLHMLAAKHKDIDVVLYDCKDDYFKELQGIWKAIEPNMDGKSLGECVKVITDHLQDREKKRAAAAAKAAADKAAKEKAAKEKAGKAPA